MSTATTGTAAPARSLKQFLESTPPEVYEDVQNLFVTAVTNYGRKWELAEPDILLHCSSDDCNGPRLYKHYSDTLTVPHDAWAYCFVTYKCRNCGRSSKSYALAVYKEEGIVTRGRAYKFGEIPVFGPQVPARVITLIGPDRDHFLLGRRAENHGLGIGAFAYYRRVVENQKGRIIKEIARVAKKLGAAPEVLQDFEKAATETQFKTAIDDIKTGLPSVLMIEGHNPLTLLHTALSEGLHEENDKTCLELAQSIRTVLTELADRMSSVMKDQQELHTAVSKLLNRKTGQPVAERPK
ncbi:MAG: hypothetical protein WCG81_00885 [Candidatus Angelobacter sp.]